MTQVTIVQLSKVIVLEAVLVFVVVRVGRAVYGRAQRPSTDRFDDLQDFALLVRIGLLVNPIPEKSGYIYYRDDLDNTINNLYNFHDSFLIHMLKKSFQKQFGCSSS